MSVDVSADPDGLVQLRALGARSVPIVSRGKSYTLCQSMSDVVRFLGLRTRLANPLPPEVLVDRLDRVLGVAARLTRQFPEDRLHETFRNRDRTLGNTAYHVFRVAEMGLETACGLPLQPDGFSDKAPRSWSAADIASWGDTVRGRLVEWWNGKADHTMKNVVPTYYGEKPMIDVFERTTWHAAQHTRQLALMLESHGIAPDGPLTAQDVEGLPLPENVWG